MSTISNKQTLRLKKMVVNGRNQTVYHPKIYRPRELPQFIVDENVDSIEVVDSPVKEENKNAVTLQGDGIRVTKIVS